MINIQLYIYHAEIYKMRIFEYNFIKNICDTWSYYQESICRWHKIRDFKDWVLKILSWTFLCFMVAYYTNFWDTQQKIFIFALIYQIKYQSVII